ncbi:MAG: FG-GAP repeat domain-containing protein [Pirellula sp.]
MFRCIPITRPISSAKRMVAGCVFALSSLVVANVAVGQEMRPLKYNHPGLSVDLGVGLWAWPIPCDADGDGDLDLLVSCPDKPSNGIWLFENANGSTKATPLPNFRPARRISGTVHYVMPSYVHGELRVLSPGKEYKNFTQTGTSEAVTLGVPADFYKPRGPQQKGPKVRHNQWRYVDYDGDSILDLVVGVEDWSYYGWDDAYDADGNWTAGPLRGFVFIHKGLGDGNYAAPSQVMLDGVPTGAAIPLETFGCPSPNFEDFDGDGDLDLLCGEFLDGFTYFQNIGSRRDPKYAAGRRLKTADGNPLVMELQMIVPIAIDWDLDGAMDLIVGDEDGRVAWIRNSTKKTSDDVPIFDPPEYFKQEADTLKCGALATPVGVDWDHDGDQDILSGNTSGKIEYFENLSGPNIEAPKWSAPVQLSAGGKPFRITAGSNGSIQGPAEAKWGYTTFSVADWDLDGLEDVILNSILGEVVWLKNIGSKHQPELQSPTPIEVEWTSDQPVLNWGWKRPTSNALLTQWRTTPVVHDFNQDRLPDLAMLDTEGYLALYERYRNASGRLLVKEPVRCFFNADGQPLQLNPKRAGGSGRRKFCVADWNRDGLPDLLLNSKNADLLLRLKSEEPGLHYEVAGALANQNIEGHDVSPTVVDFDGNGIPDFLGGAEDGRLYYLRNSLSK